MKEGGVVKVGGGAGDTPLRDGLVGEPKSVGGQHEVGGASQRHGKVAGMC